MPTRSPLGREVRTLLIAVAFVSGVVGVLLGERQEPAGDRVAALRVARDHEHGVVAGDGAEHLAELGLVDGRGEELGGAGRRPQHDEVGARLGTHQQLGAQPGQPLGARGGLPRRRGSPVAALAGDGVDEGSGGRAHADGVQLDEVARERALRDVHAGLGEQVGELGLRPHLVAADQVDDLLVPGALGRRAQGGLRHRLLQEPGDDRLLGVAAVLGLVPDDALRAVEDVGVDLLAPVGRQAVHDDRVGRRVGHQLGGDGVVGEHRQPLLGLALLAHRDPGVGDHDVGAVDGLDRVALEQRGPAGARADGVRAVDHRLLGLLPLGRADADVHAGRHPGEEPGVAHVAGAVADERDRQAGEGALVLLDGQQVGEQLAGVVVVGEGVDDRHPGVRRHLLDRVLAVGAPHDHRGLPAEHPRHVGDRLALADAGQGAVDQHRVPAELGDAGGERRLRAQRRLVVDGGDGERAGERLRVVRRPLQLDGEVEHRSLLGGAEVVVGEEGAESLRGPP